MCLVIFNTYFVFLIPIPHALHFGNHHLVLSMGLFSSSLCALWTSHAPSGLQDPFYHFSASRTSPLPIFFPKSHSSLKSWLQFLFHLGSQASPLDFIMFSVYTIKIYYLTLLIPPFASCLRDFPPHTDRQTSLGQGLSYFFSTPKKNQCFALQKVSA